MQQQLLAAQIGNMTSGTQAPGIIDMNMVQCSYQIQEGQIVTGKSQYYQDAASAKKEAVRASESPEGVLDSSSPKGAAS